MSAERSRHTIRVRVNGVDRVETVEARLLLVDLLRERLELRGTHIGCDTSNCGCCTVLVDGAAIKSCTYLAVQTDGREVTTIEGLAAAEEAAATSGAGDAARSIAGGGRTGTAGAEAGHEAGHEAGGEPAAERRLGVVQQAFTDLHALQCGYCTPGMVMTAAYLLARNPDPSEDEIRHGIAGNLCRCTGYQFIVEAIEEAARRLRAGRTGG